MAPRLVELAALLAWAYIVQRLGRRLGPRRAGLLLGLPGTTAVALLACAYESGPEAAMTMAGAGLLGLVPAAALPLAFAGALGRGRSLPRALAAALAAYAALAVGLGCLPALGGGGRLSVAAAALLALVSRSRRRPAAEDAPEPRRPARGRARHLLVPAACLVLVTALRDQAGAARAGLLTPFPGVTLALLVSTYSGAGPRAACRLARAVPRGTLGTLAFLAVVVVVGPRLGPAWGAAAGSLAALVVLGVVAGTAGPGASGRTAAVRDVPASGGGRPSAIRWDAAGRARPRRRVGVRRPGLRLIPRLELLGA
jgi:hypothetical protein